MRKKYDEGKIFSMISESYEQEISAVDYCRTKNFPVKVFYRYRRKYNALYGTSPLAEASSPETIVDTDKFIALEPTCLEPRTGIVLELGSAYRLRFEALPDALYLSTLLKSLGYAPSK